MRYPTLNGLLATQYRERRREFRSATACAVLASGSAVALLGISGWFLAAAAGAGLAGAVAAHAFNYLLPSAAVRLLAIVRTAGRYGERLTGHDAALHSMASVRQALFGAIVRTPAERALSLSVGEAATVLMQDGAAIEDRLVRRPAAWAAIAALTCGVALAGSADWRSAAAIAICAGALVLSARGICHRRQATSRAIRAATAALKDELALLAAAGPELRCYGMEDWAARRTRSQGRRLRKLQERQAADHGLLDLLLMSATGICAVLSMVSAAGRGAPLMALAGLSAAMAIEGLAPWLRARQQAADAVLGSERLEEWLSSAPAPDDSQVLPMEDASLCLPLMPTTLLEAGDRVSIVGTSGCGKSKLLESLLGLRACEQGQILIAGIDASTMTPRAMRRYFAWLPQDGALISGTVRENLGLARDDFDEAAVWQALHDAVLDERIIALPQGLDTWIGEDGTLLSGGERRRLALARAYLREAPWLVLDEPTESLDAATEALVVERLMARLDRSGQGLLAVSHRPSMVLECDVVLPFSTHTSEVSVSRRMPASG